MRITVTLMAAGLLVAAFGCGTSIQTNYDYDVNANFEQYSTYNWIPRDKVLRAMGRAEPDPEIKELRARIRGLNQNISNQVDTVTMSLQTYS